MHDDLVEVPEFIDSGTTVIYTKGFDEFAADAGWAATLYLAGPSILNVAGAPSGSDFVFTLSAAQTAALLPGGYSWIERVSQGGQKFDADSGRLTVRPDVAAATTGSLETWESKTLTAIEAFLSGNLTAGVAGYSIAGRSIQYIPLTELLTLRGQLKRAVRAQQYPGRLTPEIRVCFSGVESER